MNITTIVIGLLELYITMHSLIEQLIIAGYVINHYTFHLFQCISKYTCVFPEYL